MAASMNSLTHVWIPVKMCSLCFKNSFNSLFIRSVSKRVQFRLMLYKCLWVCSICTEHVLYVPDMINRMTEHHSRIDSDHCNDCDTSMWKHKSSKKAPNLSPEQLQSDQALKNCKPFPKNIDLDPKAVQRMEEEGLKPSKHPGIMRLKTVKVPKRMEVAAFDLSKKYGSKTLQKESEELVRYINGRHPPLELSEIEEHAKEIEQKIIQKENIDVSNLSRAQKSKLKDKVVRHLKYTVYQWKPIRYDAFKGMTYMVGRLAQNYSVLLQCLSEIWKRDPEFLPNSMYNLGSGVGSAVWAVNEIWGKNVKEYYCVDTSPDMNTVARLLLQGGYEQYDMHIKGVHFKQFEPSVSGNKFPLVISAYILLEQPDQAVRRRLVESLWERTDGYLILVENGTYAGHRLIQEARDHILKISSESVIEDNCGHVFAPCSHDKICPKFQLSTKTACTFAVKYKPLQIFRASESDKREKYSYVILRKGWSAVNEERLWPRFTMEKSRTAKHLHCRLCCPDGNFHHMIMTVSKQAKDLYHVARNSDWGDLLPVVWPDTLLEEDKDKPSPQQLKRMKYLKKREQEIASYLIKDAESLNEDIDTSPEAEIVKEQNLSEQFESVVRTDKTDKTEEFEDCTDNQSEEENSYLENSNLCNDHRPQETSDRSSSDDFKISTNLSSDT